MESTITPKQAFEMAVERERYRRQIANEMTEQMRNLNRELFWESLGIVEVGE